MIGGERSVRPAGAADRSDAIAFLSRAIRVGDAAVVRLARRADGRIALWTTTGFEVLATRSVFGEISPGDIVCDAAQLRAALQAAEPGEEVDPGFSFDSAWRGALPVGDGYVHLDDVPARALVSLVRDGAVVARTQGSAHGPATGLLDQPVLEVSADNGGEESGGEESGGATATISMRSLFALTSMGFVRDRDGHEITDTSPIERIDDAEPVRIRVSRTWIRLDARFGSVYQRRTADLAVTPVS